MSKISHNAPISLNSIISNNGKTHPWTERNRFEDTFNGEQHGEDHVEVTQNIFEKQWRSMKVNIIITLDISDE